MYKIILTYQSDKNDIFKQEIETASSEFEYMNKRDNLINTWLSYFSNELFGNTNVNYSISVIGCNYSYKLNYEYKYELIQLYIKYLNMSHIIDKNRTFEIVVEEII